MVDVLTERCERWAPIDPGCGLEPAWRLTAAQLHGHACVVCADAVGLVSVGHIYTKGTAALSRLGWPVVACAKCRAGSSSE